MAKGKIGQHVAATPGRTVGWIVLVAGIITLLFGAVRLLFVVSYGFVAEMTVERTGLEPICVESATDAAAECEDAYKGTIFFNDGTVVDYAVPEEYAAAVESLRAGQRTKSGLILLAGVAASAVGVALLAATHHAEPKRRSNRPSRRRSSARA